MPDEYAIIAMKAASIVFLHILMGIPNDTL